MTIVSKLLSAALAVALLTPVATFAQAPAKTDKTPAKTATAALTAQDIADAKAKGLVWVNTSSGVWHVAGDRYYGKTKQGQFMSVTDATKAGYHAAKEGAVKSKTATSTPASTTTGNSGSTKDKKN